MAYRFKREHRELFRSLNKHDVDYMLIGGVAVNLHGYTRGTGDLDILFESSVQNKQKLMDAIEEYGFDTTKLRKISPNKITMFALGERTYQGHIELTNRISGITYREAARRTQRIQVAGVNINYIHYEDLIRNKLASGRRKDLVDVEKLKQVKQAELTEGKHNKLNASTKPSLTLWERIKQTLFSRND